MQAGNIQEKADSASVAERERCLPDWNSPAFQAPLSFGVLIFDSKGLVRFCSAALAQLIGANAKELTGTCVRELLPALPFDPATEGYNVAFGIFRAAKRCLEPWSIQTRDGGMMQAQGYFGSLETDDGYRFCLQLQLPAGLDALQAGLPSAATGTTLTIASAGVGAFRHPAGTPASRHAPWAMPVTAPDSVRAAAAGIARPPQVQLLFDRDYRVSFASSSIEDLLSHDYERVIGMHVSDLLPDVPSRVGVIRSISSATARLRSIGSFRSHARHASGRRVPVLVALREKKYERLISLLISAAGD